MPNLKSSMLEIWFSIFIHMFCSILIHVLVYFFSCFVNIRTKCFVCVCVLFYDFVLFNQIKLCISSLQFMAFRIIWLPPLAVCSPPVELTWTLTWEVRRHMFPQYLHYQILFFFYCRVFVCLYLQFMAFRRTCQMLVVSSLESLQVSNG